MTTNDYHRLHDTYNHFFLYKHEGETSEKLSNYVFEIWTEEDGNNTPITSNNVIACDENGNAVYNHQQFTTDENGVIELIKLRSWDNENGEQYILNPLTGNSGTGRDRYSKCKTSNDCLQSGE